MKGRKANGLDRIKEGTRAAIYNRVSTEKLTQLEAIGHQVEESRELVENSHLVLVEQYVETESGTSLKGREEYKRMLKDMALGRFDVLVVKSQDRMMRNQTEWHLLKNAVRRYHKEIYFYMEDEVYDPRENGLKHDVQAMLDEYESEKKSEKAVHSHERRQRDYRGQECLNITRPVFGWDRHTELDEYGHKRVFFTVNEREAGAIREACKMAEDGLGFYRIAKAMYEKDVLSKPTFGTNPQPPKRMDGNTWKKILYSPLLHGDALMNRVKTDFYTKERIKVPKEDWILRRDVIPPILERGYHEYLLSLLEERSRKGERKAGTASKASTASTEKSIWTGKIFCYNCGCNYYGRKMRDKNGAGYYKFRCGNRFRGGICDNIVLDERSLNRLLEACLTENFHDEILAEEEKIKKLLKKLLEKAFLKGEKEKSLCQDRESLNAKQNRRLLDLYVKGEITKEEYLLCRQRLESAALEGEKGGNGSKNPEEILENTIKAGLIHKAVMDFLSAHVLKASVEKDGKIRFTFPEDLFAGKEGGQKDKFLLIEADLSFIC